MSTENNNTENDDIENNLNSTNVPTNESTLDEQQLPAKNSQTRGSRPPKKINEDKLTNEVLVSVNEHFKRPAPLEDRYDLMGKTIAIKLRALEKTQRLIAEKIINDTLFEAEMGHLNHDSYGGKNKPHQYRTGRYISTPSPTYISSPLASPITCSRTQNSSSSLMQQAQTMHTQSYQYNQLHSDSSQNSYLVQSPPVLSIPEDTMSASSYYSNVNFDNL